MVQGLDSRCSVVFVSKPIRCAVQRFGFYNAISTGQIINFVQLGITTDDAEQEDDVQFTPDKKCLYQAFDRRDVAFILAKAPRQFQQFMYNGKLLFTNNAFSKGFNKVHYNLNVVFVNGMMFPRLAAQKNNNIFFIISY